MGKKNEEKFEIPLIFSIEGKAGYVWDFELTPITKIDGTYFLVKIKPNEPIFVSHKIFKTGVDLSELIRLEALNLVSMWCGRKCQNCIKKEIEQMKKNGGMSLWQK